MYKGFVYITDETMRHEITSWRLNNDVHHLDDSRPRHGSADIHVVLVVDQSGSMNKDDVPGFQTRTAAVYHTLAHAVLRPLLKNTGGSKWFFTLITMKDSAEILGTERMPLDESLCRFVLDRKGARARSHGNYLPALKLANQVLSRDRPSEKVVVFLSDGAPSDHTWQQCSHGTAVWQCDHVSRRGKAIFKTCTGPWEVISDSDYVDGMFYVNNITGEIRNGRPGVFDCSRQCRREVKERMERECAQQLMLMQEEFGRNHLHVQTIGFGNPNETFTVLKNMAQAIKHGTFTKNGLNAKKLLDTFNTLTSSLTELSTTLSSAGQTKTLRTDVQKGSDPNVHVHQIVLDIYPNIKSSRRRCLRDILRWSRSRGGFKALRSSHERWDVDGVVHSKKYFWDGAERLVFKFREYTTTDDGFGMRLRKMKMVAKQTKEECDEMFSLDFHAPFCRAQSDASEWAKEFNSEISKILSHSDSLRRASQVRYLKPLVYKLRDPDYGGYVHVLVEELLAGKYSKWNNNAGQVKLQANHHQSVSAPLGAFNEESEEDYDSRSDFDDIFFDSDDDDDDDNDDGCAVMYHTCALRTLTVEQLEFAVPQCFSHFTYERSKHQELVCDIQGVWNRIDGFTLTDPVIHHRKCNKKTKKLYGCTDKGIKGMHKFMETHQCNVLCQTLGLPRCK